MGTAVKATERDQFWLDHEAKLSGSELTAKAYAAEQGLCKRSTKYVVVQSSVRLVGSRFVTAQRTTSLRLSA